MMKQLVQYFEQCLRDMDFMESKQGKHIFLDQAFGSVRFVQMLVDDDTELLALWNEWKPKFEEKVWGC